MEEESHTKLEILDKDGTTIAKVHIPPINVSKDAIETNEVKIKPPSLNQWKPTKISVRLLHRRLGHRPMSTIVLAGEHNLWEDTEVVEDRDDFCETCKITTARIQPIEGKNELGPGTFVTVDIVNNPATRSITANTYFPYYLGITDVTSRFFVPRMGSNVWPIEDLRPGSVDENTR